MNENINGMSNILHLHGFMQTSHAKLCHNVKKKKVLSRMVLKADQPLAHSFHSPFYAHFSLPDILVFLMSHLVLKDVGHRKWSSLYPVKGMR